ncbi:MAG: TIGR00366 family protein [Phycisphaerales bacterium]
MISRLGLALSAVFRKVVPDPFVIAVLLMVLTAALALVCGDFPGGAGAPRTVQGRALALLDEWRSSEGVWKLLGFGMQMCLILVTGHALAASRPVAAVLRRLADLPRSGAQAAALVALIACLAGVINWGLGLIVGAVLARDAGRSAARRGITVHCPLLAAAGYMGLLVFHGGLSGSAPLAMSTPEGAAKVLRPEHVAALNGRGIGLDLTLGSTLNLVVTGGLVLGLPLLFALLHPATGAAARRSSGAAVVEDTSHGCAAERREPMAPNEADGAGRIPAWLDRTPLVVWALALVLVAAVARFVVEKGWSAIGFNEVNALMFALGLACHGSARSYLRALEHAAAGCAGIVVQFPIYAGIMGMMSVSGLNRQFAQGITAAADADTLPVLTFLAATLVGLFVPSGGAQWSIQGPVALESAASHGVDLGTMVMAVGYGDELANMLQPFWALPLLAITGVKARDIVGYTAIAMVAAAAWMALGLLML